MVLLFEVIHLFDFEIWHSVFKDLSIKFHQILTVFAYLDDVLILSPDHGTHFIHLRRLLERFSQYSLTINLDKCKFSVSSLDYLGHHIDATGIKPIAHKVKGYGEFS